MALRLLGSGAPDHLRQRNLLPHLLVPIGILALSSIHGTTEDPGSLGDIAVAVAASATYLLAPYAGLLLLVHAVKPHPVTAHAGMAGLGAALLSVIAIGHFSMRDPSGLPYHWVLYWPLCLMGVFVFIGAACMVRRVRGHDR